MKAVLYKLVAGVISICLLGPHSLSAKQATLHIAVASNFQYTLKQLLKSWQEQQPQYKTLISNGSTGLLYAQIRQGAPYDILMAADSERPLQLERAGHIVPGSRLTYAIGQLAFWSPNSNPKMTLQQQLFKRLAIANPKTAPYGQAALFVLQNTPAIKLETETLIQGENIVQTFQFIQSGNAEAGFVALSLLIQAGIPPSQYTVIPQNMYPAIQQQAVLLNNTAAARQFMQFMQSDTARHIMKTAGYYYKH